MTWSYSDIELRDIIAIEAMKLVFVEHAKCDGVIDPQHIAEKSYELADSMLAERDRQEK